MSSVSIRNLAIRFGAVDVLKSLDLDIKTGEFLVLLGSSGCGKSTLLNCIAGLIEPSEGEIWIGDRDVTWEEPKDRGIGMVFQSYALYPQMSVRNNLSFGLKVAGMAKDEISRRVDRASEILQITHLLDRKPAALSGGQRQRVAIGRALVRDVDVFLFDEPLSNLDAKLRSELRVEIRKLHMQLENTMIYVTHDQIEAMTLADRIAIMRGGQVMQLAAPMEIYNRPVNLYVASFIGSPPMNFFDGDLNVADGPALSVADHKIPLTGYPFNDVTGGRRAVVGIRPEHVRAGSSSAGCDFTTSIKVNLVEQMGADTVYYSMFNGSPFIFRTGGSEVFRAGEDVMIGWNTANVSVFDAQTEERL